jgi:predicted transcriptional regulator
MAKRSRLEISCDILKLILEGEQKPTQLMFKANISWDVIKDLLELMIKKELITQTITGKARRYDITEKGIQTLSYYQNAIKEIELFVR